MNAVESNKRFHGRRKARCNNDGRRETQKDFDRVLYSNAFQRLANVTQVVNPKDNVYISNRLTHSLKVAQLAKRMTINIQQKKNLTEVDLSSDAAAVAGLAHDLGHPPFGHVGEKTLHNIMISPDADYGDVMIDQGYEGNAQSFRILTHIAIRETDWNGLNLTRRGLNAVMKYPWYRDSSDSDATQYSKWGCYKSEEEDEVFQEVRKMCPENEKQNKPTIEAQIMDWADDVAYAVYDCVDFYKAGLIPLHQLLSDKPITPKKEVVANEGGKFLEWLSNDRDQDKTNNTTDGEYMVALESLVNHAKGNFIEYDGSCDVRAKIRNFCSLLLDSFICKPVIEEQSGVEVLLVPEELRYQVDILKKMNWRYVINSPSLSEIQAGHEVILEQIFSYTVASAKRNPDKALPPLFAQRYVEAANEGGGNLAIIRKRKRIVCDYISGLTENQAVEKFKRIRGIEPQINTFSVL